MTRKRRLTIGYAKLGRSMELKLEKCGSLGGDNEMIPTLKLLAQRHQEHDFVLVGRNSLDEPRDVGLPSNVSNPWIETWPALRLAINEAGLNYSNLSVEDHLRLRDLMTQHTHHMFKDLDHVIVWIGQHGTSNFPLPSIKNRAVLTKPYDWANLYAGYLLNQINLWRDVDPKRREPIYLNADARNYPKFRDSKHPLDHPILGQFNQINLMKHETGTDVCESPTKTIYSRLEISSLLPGTPFGNTINYNNTWEGRDAFGIVFNETRREVSYDRSRLKALIDYVIGANPAFIHGVWSEKSIEQVHKRHIPLEQPKPIPLLEYIPKLQTVHSTLTTPASGSGWATAKPWEAFAAGVVCFFHPLYDTQNNILCDAPKALSDFLRVDGPATLRRRIKMVHDDAEIFGWVIAEQRKHFEKACSELRYLKMIETRLGL